MCLPTRLALTDSLRNCEVPNHLHLQSHILGVSGASAESLSRKT